MKLKILVSTIVSIMIWPASIAAQGELIPMIEIPAGNFYMGTLGEDENYDEAPMHKVYISKPFKIGLTEVTNAQYELFCLYLANLHTSFLCNLIYPTFSRILLYSC